MKRVAMFGRAGGEVWVRRVRPAVVVVGLVLAVIVLKVALDPLTPGGHGGYMMATLAVVVAAVAAGIWAGVAATALLAAVAAYLWAAPVGSFRMEKWEDAEKLVLFAAVGTLASVLAGQKARAKRRARVSEEQFRQVFEQGPIGVTIVRGDFMFQATNRMLCQMLGYEEGGLNGRSVESVTFPEDWPEDHVMLRRAWEGEIPGYSRRKRYVRKDGSVFWARVNVGVVHDRAGRPDYLIGMILDVSEPKRMEEELARAKGEAEEANRAKDQFMAVLSHELRTPLTPVLLTASTMEADPAIPAGLREEIHAIRQNVELEARLIDDLLDVTGIARGKLSLRRSRVDAQALIGQALYMVERDAAGKGVRVCVEEGAKRAEVDGDPARLEQVFWNLLKNAVKFTPAGGEVSVRTWNEGDGPGWLVAEVRDTGIGIAPEVLPRLFKAFEQASPGVTRRYGGLGLGLAISGSIVEMHGGWIRATSEGVGKGATFTVGIPLAPAGEAAAAPCGPGAPAGSDGGSGAGRVIPGPMRVLVVEDHPATRRAMTAIVRSLGHDVRAAGTVAEAEAMLGGAEGFDLVISDLALPDGSGHDLMRHIKASARPVRGVAVSGFGMEDDLRRSREAGFDDHLTKPVSREAIRAVLDRAGACGERPA